MTTKTKTARIYVRKQADEFHIIYFPPYSEIPQTLHIVKDEDLARGYAEGVIDGMDLAANLLGVSRMIGTTKGRK
jgi:hypothetical protein